MQSAQQEAIEDNGVLTKAQSDGLSRRTRPKAVRREIERGHIVTIQYADKQGGWEPAKEYQLALKTDLTASPQRIGPELPLYQSLIGKRRKMTVQVNCTGRTGRTIRINNFHLAHA